MEGFKEKEVIYQRIVMYLIIECKESKGHWHHNVEKAKRRLRKFKAITSQLAQKKHTKNEQPNKVAHFHYIKFRFKYCSIVSLMIVFIFFSCSETIRPFSIASWTITSVSPFC